MQTDRQTDKSFRLLVSTQTKSETDRQTDRQIDTDTDGEKRQENKKGEKRVEGRKARKGKKCSCLRLAKQNLTYLFSKAASPSTSNVKMLSSLWRI